jgi:hypothetical protein
MTFKILAKAVEKEGKSTKNYGGLSDTRINPLNAELNSTCHLLILLGDLTSWIRAS